ncbi:MAG: thioredoxin [Candidatus Eisenbacteria bacterium]|uniref:Thioredoxin n=1 Tax=Eiseniibacteriota bacterium TaxID=2212470 RepID=A0A849SQ35_UNCEI|nr:thioredoxin [Candidatus Eisenbacteria bacterium]
MSNAMNVSDQTFEAEVIQSTTPVLVDFWAPWCGPCRQIAPTIDQLAIEYQGKLKVVKVNVDENIETGGRYGVVGIPTLLIFKGGEVVEKLVGAYPKPALISKITQYL